MVWSCRFLEKVEPFEDVSGDSVILSDSDDSGDSGVSGVSNESGESDYSSYEIFSGYSGSKFGTSSFIRA